MKTQEFAEVKKLDIKTLLERVKALRVEIIQGVMDKNMNKLKDLKTISKKKKNLAQVLTVLRQKQLLESLETKVENLSSKELKVESPKVKTRVKSLKAKKGEEKRK